MNNNIWFNSPQVIYRDKHRWRGFYEERIPWQPFLYYYLYGHYGTAGLKIRKNIYRPNIYELLLSFMVISNAYRSSVPNKTTFTKYSLTWVDFKAPRKLWNPLSKAVPGKFHVSGRHNNCNCLQVWANYHRSQSYMANCPNFNTGVAIHESHDIQQNGYQLIQLARL